MVTAIFEAADGALWIGTWGGGLNRFDRDAGAFDRFLSGPGDEESLASNFIPRMQNPILEESAGRLWIATNAGLSRLDPGTGRFTTYRGGPEQVSLQAGAPV